MAGCRAIPALGEYATIQAEVKSGPAGRSRVDFLLQRRGGGLVFVEVKSVTLAQAVGPPAAEVCLAVGGGGRARACRGGKGFVNGSCAIIQG